MRDWYWKIVARLARPILAPLLRGIERWAADEDGIPRVVFRPWVRARVLLGEPVTREILEDFKEAYTDLEDL